MGYTATYPAVYPSSAPTGLLEIDVTAPQPPQAKGPWRFLYGPTQEFGGGAAQEILQAQNKTVTLRPGPDQNHEISFDIDGLSPAAADLTELENDLIVMFGDDIVFDGRFGGSQDSLGASGHRTQISAFDYREFLRRQPALPGDQLSWAGVDVATIAWNMIQAVQGQPGGKLGISRGHGQSTGINRTHNIAVGDMYGDVITTLAQLQNGFDWAITPYGMSDLRLDIFAPHMGRDQGVVLAYGDSRISSITRTVDPSTFADVVYVTGETLNAAQTTVELLSDGGTISNIGSWLNPLPGALSVADTEGFLPSGKLKVHASGQTNAIISYSGIAGGGGVFTGCQYISGSPSGVVHTGNSVQVVQLAPQHLESGNIATHPAGRWGSVVGTNDKTQETLNAHAAALLDQLQVVTPSYQVVFYPGAWDGLDWISPGDTITLRINSGRLQVNDQLRAVEMAFSISPENVETLTLTLGQVPFRLHRAVPNILKRLKLLETR